MVHVASSKRGLKYVKRCKYCHKLMVKLDDLVFYHFFINRCTHVLLHKNQNASFDLHSFPFEKVMNSPNYLYIQLNHNKISIHIY